MGVINYLNKNNILVKRFFSSIILIFFALYINHLGGIYLIIATFSASIVLLIELYKLFEIKVLQPIFIKNILFYVISFLLIYYDQNNYLFILFFLGFFVSFVIFKNKIFFILLSYIYILLPLVLLVFLSKGSDGKTIIYWIFLVVWTTDVSGYIFGKIIKGPKLIPSISPNKTWSGFLSGIFLSGIFSIVFSFLIGNQNYINFFFLGALGSIISSIGDLFESKLKRLRNKKDVSNFIPGHGGLLDRLDGFLFAILYFYILSLF